jgi:hypothetical protein
MAILKLFEAMALDGKGYTRGVYEVVEGTEAQAGEITRTEADALKKAYPDSAKEFAGGEKIENVAEWKRKNTTIS